MNTAWKEEPLYIVIAIVAAFLLLRIVMLFTLPFDLYPDEAQYWTWSLEPSFGYFSKPPFIAWLIGTTTALCGDTEACIRLGAPILHSTTALVIFFLGRVIYNERVGAFAALLYITLPAIVFSSLIISTDVPLLLFWAVALFSIWNFFKTKSLVSSLCLGLAVGLGLLSKYAMAYFVGCALLYISLTPETRWVFKNRNAGIAVLVALLLVLPNIIWNINQGGVTFTHTASNANLSAELFHPDNFLEFITSQIGVFGPFAFGILCLGLWRLWYRENEVDRFLLFFSLPVLAAVCVIAFLSRANANWAATAYIALTLLVASWCIRLADKRVRVAVLASHVAIMVLFTAFVYLPVGSFLPRSAYPLHRVIGWKDMASEVQVRFQSGEYTSILTTDRDVFAELRYYLKESPPPLVMWTQGEVHNHYQLTSPIDASSAGRPLFVTVSPRNGRVLMRFDRYEYLGAQRMPLGPKRERVTRFYALSGNVAQ